MCGPVSWRLLAAWVLCLPLCCAGTACSAHAPDSPASVGKLAPETSGADLEGASLDLGEFRGKVVLLEFWGNWWGPCRGMFPHTRAFMERYAAEPFEVVGVNSDTQMDRLKLVIEKQKIQWRSFWNGPKGVKGPIARAWAVEEWPTVCLLDTRGVIRYRSTQMDIPEIDGEIQKLLAELHPPASAAK